MKFDAETLSVTEPRPPRAHTGSGGPGGVAFRFHARAFEFGSLGVRG